eukprot:Gb_01313 [translate_table: standard]
MRRQHQGLKETEYTDTYVPPQIELITPKGVLVKEDPLTDAQVSQEHGTGGRSLVKWIGTTHGIGVLEYIIGVRPSIGLTSDVLVGYPHMRTKVRAKVPIEIVMVAPIWEHCGILSKVKVVATPGVVVGPLIAPIHVLVVVGPLSGWTVGHVGCATTDVSSLSIGLGLVELRIALMSLITARCLLVNIWATTCKQIHIIGPLLMPQLLLAILVLSVDVSSSALQQNSSSSLSKRVTFRRSLIMDSNISSKCLLFVGKMGGDSSHGLFGFDSRSLFINFFIEFVLMSKTKGSPLAHPVGAREIPPMALPLVDISPSLQEGQYLRSPCHWTLEYVQDSCLRLRET